MTTDWAAYRDAVLEPAREACNTLPADLCARYGIDGGHLQSDARFKARVDEIVKYWKKLELTSKLYKSLALALLADHARLTAADLLDRAKFRHEREAAREQGAARLRQWAKTIAGDIPRVTGATLSRLAEMTDGLLDERQVRAELAKAKVSVIEPDWPVPSHPPVATAVVLRTHLNVLGLTLSPQLIFPDGTLAKGYTLKGGFRLADGRRLTSKAVVEAQGEQARRPHNSLKTAAETVLATLAKAVAVPATLDALILWEVAALLQRSLDAGLPVSLVAQLATETGLAQVEAEELAVTLSAGSGPSGSPRATDRDTGSGLVLGLLAAGNLREAERLLGQLGPDEVGDDAQAKVTAAAARVIELRAQAEAAQRGGRTEEAAQLLADAVQSAHDDADLAAHLARIPPPPATDARVGVGDGPAILQWTPRAAQIGQVRYCVRRTAGAAAVSAAAGDLVTETSSNQATDLHPPVAVPLFYTVFASRDPATWSAGAAAGPVTLLPPIAELALSADAQCVTGNWRPHPSATAVRVTRSCDDQPGDVTPVPTVPGAAVGFVDQSVRAGLTYTYTVTAMYAGASGALLAAPPVTESIVPVPAPTAVTDLAVEALVDETSTRLRMTWTAPAGGTVVIRRAGGPPPWPAGARVPLAVAASYGDVLDGPRQTGPDGPVTMLVTGPGLGRFVCSALTVGRSEAVIGNTVAVELLAAVSGLLARRRWDTVTVSWQWPPGVREARIHWSTLDQDVELTCTKRQFYDNGGVVLATGPEEVTVSVAALIRERGELLASPVVTTVVGSRRPALTWSLQRSAKRHIILRLRGDQSCPVPALVLVVGREILTRLEPQWITPGNGVALDVTGVVNGHPIDRIDCRLADPGDDGPILTRSRGKR